jgi:hypothetical protein
MTEATAKLVSEISKIITWGPEKDPFVRLEINRDILLPEAKAQKVKKILREGGVEVKKYPFEFSENIVIIRKSQVPLAIDLLKKKLEKVV